jgi:hypothetical protein
VPQSPNFGGIVGQEVDAGDPQMLQHVARDIVPSCIVREAQKPVCIDGVVTIRL